MTWMLLFICILSVLIFIFSAVYCEIKREKITEIFNQLDHIIFKINWQKREIKLSKLRKKYQKSNVIKFR